MILISLIKILIFKILVFVGGFKSEIELWELNTNILAKWYRFQSRRKYLSVDYGYINGGLISTTNIHFLLFSFYNIKLLVHKIFYIFKYPVEVKREWIRYSIFIDIIWCENIHQINTNKIINKTYIGGTKNTYKFSN